MGSKDRRLIVKSKYDFKEYYYIVNGQQYKRQQVIDTIINVLDGTSLTIKEIAKKIKIEERPLLNIMKVMRENNLIINTKLRRSGNYLFRTQNDCLLAQHFYPKPNDIEKKFKVLDRRVRKVDEGTSKSSRTNQNNVVYTNSYYDNVYWGD